MNFALIGAAGFVAPRHMKAIRETGGELHAAYDPNDSVGIIDSYFPDARFFIDAEPFENFLEEARHTAGAIDFVSICSPNHLHHTHSRMALGMGANAICEKPIALLPNEIDEMAEAEEATGRRVFPILQLRLHPAIQALKERIAASPGRELTVDLTYVASRGAWYHESWKGDIARAGGIATNIGIHFFDMLIWVFGRPAMSIVHLREARRAAGFLECGGAKIRWFLSIERADLPNPGNGKTTHRSITIDGEELEFSEGFADLHTRSYEEILAGNGFDLMGARPAIEIVSAIRTAPLESTRGMLHPILPAGIGQ